MDLLTAPRRTCRYLLLPLALVTGACDHGEVVYTCAYEQVEADGSVTEVTFTSSPLTCVDHCSVGDQVFPGKAGACFDEAEALGLADGCACRVEPSRACARWLEGRSCND